MYRYEAPPVAAVGPQLPRASALKILTSPAMQQLAFDYSDAEGVSTIRVFDVLGRTRLSEQRTISVEQPVRIDASALTSGYYILSVSNGKRTTSQGFIKQ
ncbi:MAG: T9SS type A sorting domain-containing protein [Candidatus Kapaibacterium sp.]